MISPEDGRLVRVLAQGVTRKALLYRGIGGAVAAGSLSSLLAACGSDDGTTGTGVAAGGTPPARPTGTLRVAIASQPRIFDPTLTFSVAEEAILCAVYESLVKFSDDYSELVPSLATRWEVSEDAREWRFTLREGIRFHDGADFDATVVRKTIEYYTREGAITGFWVGAPEVDDSDPGVAVFKYRDAAPDLARNSTFISMISPKLLAGSVAAAEKRTTATPVGTGPFRFVGQQQGREVTLAANDGYWDPRRPYLAALRFVVVPDESARTSALQAGDVDVVMQVPPDATGTLGSSGKVQLATTPTWTGTILDFACDIKPFDDPRVRQAVAYAIDRDAIIAAILRGRATPLEGVMPPGIYGSAPAATQYTYDPDKAKALLAEAGHTAPIEATVATYTDAVLGKLIIQAIAEQLNEVGFAITARVYDNVNLSKVAGPRDRTVQMAYAEVGWVNGGPLHIGAQGLTYNTHWKNKEYDAAFAKATTTPDGPAREQALADIIDVASQDVPWVPLFAPERIDATSANVRGYTAPPNVFSLFASAYLAG